MERRHSYNVVDAQHDVWTVVKLKKTFFLDNKPFFGFRSITEERKQEIASYASLWRQKENITSKKEYFYQIFREIHVRKNQTRENPFYVARGDESFLFFIEAFDPYLDVLKIWHEEANKEMVKKRFFEQFGVFYDDRFRQLEEYYNKRFPTISDEFNLER